MKNRYLLIAIFLGSLNLCGQNIKISAKIYDGGIENEVLIGATMKVYKGGNLIGGNVSDFDGECTYTVDSIGVYFVEFSYAGYESQIFGLDLETPDGLINVELEVDPKGLDEITNCGMNYIGFYRADLTSGGQIFTHDQLRNMY